MSRGILLIACLGATVAARPDRRIVDRIIIGDARSEQEHSYAGDDVTSGIANGVAFRQARGWIRYALTVFDDTEVTIACKFLGNAATPQVFDVIVENQIVASHTFRSAEPATLEFRIPLAFTRGHTNIMVMLRATNGSTTPALYELRSVQDHNE
ncbi:MAG: DUF6805 domain-containing protein [Gemmatimonadota bacterium]